MFKWVTYYVKDLDSSIEFYNDIIGLEVDRKISPSDEMKIAFLGKDETKVELIESSEIKSPDLGLNISLGFEVESIEKFIQKNNITDFEGPIKPNPHIKFIYIKDPNGLKVQIIENL